MKQTKKMVVAAAAAVGAVAGGIAALANVPVGAAPEPSAQSVVASSMPSPSDPADAAERARLEEEIAKAQRTLDRRPGQRCGRHLGWWHLRWRDFRWWQQCVHTRTSALQ